VSRSGCLTQGPEVAAFEQEFAAAVGALHAVAVSNCTVAIQLALLAVGVKPGDDVATVSHSFVASANAVVAVGARPVFVDVHRETLGMDPAALEAVLTPQTRAILCVHQIGIPCDLEGVLGVAARHGLPVVEDAACAIGSEVLWKGRWERIGRPHGVVACFSLHPRKIVTTGDGGMLTTADEAFARRFRLLRQHAMSVPDTVRHHSSTVVFEDYVEPAFNYRMTDLQAAVGRPQLARLADVVAERRARADRYRDAFRNDPVLRPPDEQPWARSNWQSYPVFLREGCGLSQVAALQHLMDHGVSCKRGISNAHQELAYADRARWACGPGPCNWGCPERTCRRLAESEWLRDNTLLLPLFHGMTDEEQDRVIEACRTLAGAVRRTQ
ncbi:MAG: DegT/DnrJ/EryC1/StrS family aminotransferase, partial [Acidobacteria bacterium]|nr:DegT/DnrJ/EryC1/StrS family aminotransferase [Acidobacteriota bacterium]